MEVIDGVVSPALEVVAFEDVERLHHLKGGEGWGHRAHLEPAVVDPYGLAPRRREVRQVALGEPAARFLHGPGDGLGDGTAIERFGATLHDLAKGAGELLVGHDLAGPRPAVAEVEPLRLRRASELRPRLLDELRVQKGQRHALLRPFDGGGEHALPRHRAEALEGGEPAAEIAGCGTGFGPAGQLVLSSAGGVRGGGGEADEVQHVALTPTVSGNDHEPDPARARHERLDHVQRRAYGYCRVDGIATLEEDADAGQRGGGMGRGDGPAATHDDGAIGVTMRGHGSSGRE